MTRFSVRWAVPMLAGVALLVAGCDSPPEAEKKAADAAIAAAKSAEADKYAGPAYKAVTDLQRQADSFMGDVHGTIGLRLWRTEWTSWFVAVSITSTRASSWLGTQSRVPSGEQAAA